MMTLLFHFQKSIIIIFTETGNSDLKDYQEEVHVFA
jgi:hypothetical protein